MNLKYNRLDMKNEGRTRVGLRSKASMATMTNQASITMTRQESLTSASSHINKKKKKQLKIQRKFGEDTTNIPTPSIPCKQEAQEPRMIQTPNQIQPYILSICGHIAAVDHLFHSKIFEKMEQICDIYHPEITFGMRSILLKWLIQVADKFGISSETLHICTQIIDYILIFSAEKITKKNVQLLGVASLFVASKYNEIHTLEAQKFVRACDGLYSIEQLFQMEGIILIVTNFNLQFPTLHQFTAQLFQNQNISDELSNRIRSLCNLSIFDFKLFNCFKKIHLSTVIIYFSAKLLNLDSFKSKNIMQETQMSQESFKECLMLLSRLYRERKYVS